MVEIRNDRLTGWLKMSRNLQDHWIWEDPYKLKWWMDLLLMAAWEDTKKLVGRKLIDVKRGQIVASISFLEHRWGKNHNTIISFLKLLQADGMITKKSTNNVSIITICNYEEYQGVDNLEDNVTISKPIKKRRVNREGADNLVDNPVDNPKRHFSNFGADNLLSDVNNSKSVKKVSNKKGKADNLVDSLADNQADTIKEYNNIYNNNITLSNDNVSSPEGDLSVKGENRVVEDVEFLELDENGKEKKEGEKNAGEEKKIIKKPKGEVKTPTLVSKARKVFEDFYQNQYGNAYYWTAKDGFNMKQLLQKFAYSREKKIPALPNDDEGLLDALEKYLDAAFSKSWIADNFTIPNLNSQYNSIVAEHKNKLKQNKNGRPDPNKDFIDPRTGKAISFEEHIKVNYELAREEQQGEPKSNEPPEYAW